MAPRTQFCLKRVLVVSCAGIGNTILATPMIAALKAARPNLHIDLLTWSDAAQECLRRSPLIVERYIIPERWTGRLRLIWQLRRRGYDATLTTIPSNRWQYHLLPFLIGAPQRIVHSYSVGRFRSLRFLSNRSVPAVEGMHDIENNLRLLSALGIRAPTTVPPMVFELDVEAVRQSDEWLRYRNIKNEDYLVGIHAGGSMGERKKWGVEAFAKAARAELELRQNSQLIIFGGPEEAAEKEKVADLINNSRVHVFSGSMAQSAACIARCDFFISNDTGLMHIAATFRVPQRAIFISTSIARTRPWNEHAEVVDLTNGFDYSYPFRSCR